ncbi:hypothetical protein E5288_WYG019799 [Bos mutus]|uniref:Uncharacterized protein n=1 Tax=Bos mutus TaxID=72004 RepID=A0A6B0RX61_9CETA|nr:hypothetical protein [Bos mutus]
MLTVGQQSLEVTAQESVVSIFQMALDPRDLTETAYTFSIIEKLVIDGARKQESRTSAASVLPGERHVPSKPHSAFFGTHCPGDTGLSETRGRQQGQKDLSDVYDIGIAGSISVLENVMTSYVGCLMDQNSALYTANTHFVCLTYVIYFLYYTRPPSNYLI